MASAWAYMICMAGGGEDTCRLSSEQMTEDERRDGCVEFPLTMSSKNTLRFWQAVPSQDDKMEEDHGS